MTDTLKGDLPFEIYDQRRNFTKLKCLFYGPSGVGKTVLAGSICEVDALNPTIGIDIEGGMTSLSAFDYNSLDLAEVNTFTKSERNFMKIYQYLTSNASRYNSAILDSITELQAMIMDESLEESGKKVPDLAVWSLVSGKMRKAMRRIRDLPINVIVTALEREVKDDSTGITTKHPSLSGKMGGDLPGYFDIVGRMEVRRDKEGVNRRVIHFEGNDRFLAKDRTGALGKGMEDPTMTKIYNLIQQKHRLG